MVSSKLTTEQLLKIASGDVTEDAPIDDVALFIYEHNIKSGAVEVNKKHLYIYYQHWSGNSFDYSDFCVKMGIFARGSNFYIDNCIDISLIEREVLLERKKEIEKKRS